MENRSDCLGPLNLEIGRRRRANEEGEEGKIKRTGVRELADRSAVEKRLSAHWFLEAPWLAVGDIPSRPDGAFRAFRGISMLGATALADFNLQISAFHLISCASLRFCALDVLQLLLWAYPTRIVGT